MNLDLSDLGEVTITRTFDAPIDLVWACMTTPEHLAEFWGPDGMTAPLDKIELDLRPGGVFNLTMVTPDGQEFPNHGVIDAIEPPHRLVMREPAVADMRSEWTFTALDGDRTEVRIHQTNVPAMFRSPEALGGFNNAMDRFARYLVSIRG